METNKRLRETVDRVREELRTTRAQAERSQQEAERCSCSSVGTRTCWKQKPRSLLTHMHSSLFCLPSARYLQAAGGPSSEVDGGETQAAGARSWAAAEILSGQRETAEGSSGSEEGRAQPNVCASSCTIPVLKYCFCHSLQNRAFYKKQQQKNKINFVHITLILHCGFKQI